MDLHLSDLSRNNPLYFNTLTWLFVHKWYIWSDESQLLEYWTPWRNICFQSRLIISLQTNSCFYNAEVNRETYSLHIRGVLWQRVVHFQVQFNLPTSLFFLQFFLCSFFYMLSVHVPCHDFISTCINMHSYSLHTR